jgi:hypothetical protein
MVIIIEYTPRRERAFSSALQRCVFHSQPRLTQSARPVDQTLRSRLTNWTRYMLRRDTFSFDVHWIFNQTMHTRFRNTIAIADAIHATPKNFTQVDQTPFDCLAFCALNFRRRSNSSSLTATLSESPTGNVWCFHCLPPDPYSADIWPLPSISQR